MCQSHTRSIRLKMRNQNSIKTHYLSLIYRHLILEKFANISRWNILELLVMLRKENFLVTSTATSSSPLKAYIPPTPPIRPKEAVTPSDTEASNVADRRATAMEKEIADLKEQLKEVYKLLMHISP